MVQSLNGLKVIDCTLALAGPYASLILADLGADVIKIENPSQADMRNIGSEPVGANKKEYDTPYKGENGKFMIVNRNKRGLALNLKSEEGKKIFLKLVDSADILVQNFRPGVMDRLGFGWDDLHKRNPKLIYCSISGFGEGSPYAKLGGLDLIAQGMSGLMTLTGLPDLEEPIKVGTPVTDMGTGMYGVIGILAALRHRDISGKGQHIEATLLDTPISWLTWRAAEYWESGDIPEPQASGTGGYRAFKCSDGKWVNVAINMGRLFERGAKVLGLEHLVNDERFNTDRARTKNQKLISEYFSKEFIKKTSEEWIEIMQEIGVPVGPINTISDILDEDPHTKAREMVVEVDHPRIGKMKTLGVPIKFSETPGEVKTAAPLLGQHTREILEELDIDKKDFKKLLEEGTIYYE